MKTKKPRVNILSLSRLMRQVRTLLFSASLLSVPLLARADDLFDGGKQEMIDNFGSDSNFHTIIMIVSLVIALVTGVFTKNWIAAIGGFAAFLIFFNVAGGWVGL